MSRECLSALSPFLSHYSVDVRHAGCTENNVCVSVKFLLSSFRCCCLSLPLRTSFSHLFPSDEPMCTREPQVNIHKLHNSIINLNSACVCPCIYDRGPVKRSMHMEWCWHNVLGGVQRAGVLQGSKRWMCHSMQQLQASASSDSLPKEASPEAVSLFPSV